MSKYYIVIGDIVSNSSHSEAELNRHFETLVIDANRHLHDDILSPYTITLGDELQGVSASLECAVKSVFYMEEELLKRKLTFKLRYVIYYGEITTEISTRIAHGMLGSGLAKARQIITDKRRDRPKFSIALPERKQSEQINLCFRLIEGLTGMWNPKDYNMIHDMIINSSNKEVGLKYNKNRSQIWKRRKTLGIEKYITAKKLLFSLI